MSLSAAVWGSQRPLASSTFLHHVRWGLWHLSMSGGRSTWLGCSTWPSTIYGHVVDWLVSSTLSCSLHTLIFAILSAWSSLAGLEAIIYDKSRFVDIQMSRISWVIEIVVTLRLRLWLWLLSWQRFDSSWAIIDCFCWVLQRLFDLLLLLLADEVLHLLLLSISWNWISGA